MKYVAPVLIVLILVIGALIYVRISRAATRKKEDWRKLSYRASLAESTISQIANEVTLAQVANTAVDSIILTSIVQEYQHRRDNPNVKEISR